MKIQDIKVRIVPKDKLEKFLNIQLLENQKLSIKDLQYLKINLQ